MSSQDEKHYPLESAGRVMDTNVPRYKLHHTVEMIKSHVLEHIRDFDTINYIYIIDDKDALVGVVSFRELFHADPRSAISDIMNGNVRSVHPYSDRERAALMALRNGMKAVPVVHDGKFLGVIPFDAIVRIMHAEHVEDLLRMSGVQNSFGDISRLGTESSFELVRRRLPSLIVGLIIGLVSAWWIKSFEDTISGEFLLAAFIPAIVYLSGAVGAQTQILFIRDLTFAELFTISTYVLRELKTAFLMAAALAAVFVLGGIIMGGSFALAVTLGITLVLSVFASITVALLVPWTLTKMKRDPALASGPFATSLSDISSLVIYLLVASVVFSMFR